LNMAPTLELNEHCYLYPICSRLWYFLHKMLLLPDLFMSLSQMIWQVSTLTCLGMYLAKHLVEGSQDFKEYWISITDCRYDWCQNEGLFSCLLISSRLTVPIPTG
jgi:hypothetical protein